MLRLRSGGFLRTRRRIGIGHQYVCFSLNLFFFMTTKKLNKNCLRNKQKNYEDNLQAAFTSVSICSITIIWLDHDNRRDVAGMIHVIASGQLMEKLPYETR